MGVRKREYSMVYTCETKRHSSPELDTGLGNSGISILSKWSFEHHCSPLSERGLWLATLG
jgi:hypothetical protein